jgi:hypothetical protein
MGQTQMHGLKQKSQDLFGPEALPTFFKKK